MKHIRQIWDFIFGSAVIGAAPVITFAIVSFASAYFLGVPFRMDTFPQKIAFALTMATFIVAPLAAIWFATRWRMRHRVLPVPMIWLEVPVGLVAGVAFYFFVAAMWFFADPNW